MKLKKLALFGFKSFPEPTELVFHEGTTAIVGPNGCGKSNIVDAIRWVMGEMSAKGLRGDSMEDVIFSGSESRKPLNLCEVTLTLAEVEGHLPERFGSFHEVAVTRRLHRSGESEYLINKVPCRLRDVTELFMDTGVGRRAYSVVEQGRIETLLSAKPRDRRFLIEEAAGITKYRSRKEETVRKMEHTAQNLARLGDVIGEVRREMNVLKRQAARAEAFRRLRGEKRALERDLSVSAWHGLRLGSAEARQAVRALETAVAEARARAGRLEAGLEKGRVQLLDEERAFESAQKGVYHLRNQITQREGRVEFLQREAEGLARRAQGSREEARELEARRGDLQGEAQALEEELQRVAERIAGRGRLLTDLTAQHAEALALQQAAERGLDEETRAEVALLGELTRVRHGLEHALRQRQDVARRLEGMGRQGEEVAARLREVGAEQGRREEELGTAERVRDLARGDRVRLEEELQSLRGESELLRRGVEEARRELHTDQSRLKGLEQLKDSLEWYGAGVKAILAEARSGGRNGVHGVVADAISAPAEYEAALEAALGERLQYVIVESPERGLEGVRRLKEKRAGRSSFAPLSLREVSESVFPKGGETGARGPLLDLVTVTPAYEGLARCLLGDVFVVETLEQAVRLWEANGIRATLVTLEGETLSPEGVISGGTAGAAGPGLLQRNRQIRELRERVRGLAVELGAREAALAENDARFRDLSARLETAREEMHRCELQVVHAAKDLTQLRERRERLEERREAMELERDDLWAEGGRWETEAAALEVEKARLLCLQEEEASRREDRERALAHLRDRVRAAHEDLTRLQVDEASDRERRDGLGERIRALRTSLENVSRRVVRLGEEALECECTREARVGELERVVREAEVLRTELERQEARVSELGQRLDTRRGELTAEERSASQARRDVDALQKRHGEAELGLRDLELRCESLSERFRERLGGDLETEAGAGVGEGFDPEAAETRVRALGAELEAFGEINLLAIEEHEERKNRYEFLEAQRRDLEESLASLKQAIQRINRVSRERFAETFEKVSRTFQGLYPQLFQGGEARLVLTDPEDVLETGIDIVARPAGKRPQHISLLSGGEKALTAVALIFSIFLVKPSPFCILDEVDAPLDEANIGRFCELLRSLSGASQFFLITHNKSTMEAARHLYGVTMGEPGVSRAVSVRLTEERSA
ncbi:MAG: chromosome segregation protein SMC [Deferrisomatales bacterium]